jgi:cytochrome c-type biogenesis protein
MGSIQMTEPNISTKGEQNRRYLPKWSIWLGLGLFIAIAIILTHNGDVFQPLERAISQAENQYQQWGESQPLTNPWILIPFAAGGGLLASISPCILAMLPV